jgi:UDP-N-acetylglucosamine--N-acetylmuramyl-(pentapeptide) pyrophosphoryl-undecaprenol N-acetylglucosamine transferase
MRIVVTGGGSGGHITPILAVAHELKQIDPKTEIIYIGQTGDSLGDIPAQDPNIDRTLTVRAGKLRRYHGEGWRQLLDIPTVLKNIRDVFYTIAGIFQSIMSLRSIRPDIVFIKGGFVGVPVGLAAAFWRIPYVTHDSDAIPGLANRLIAPWAYLHAVAMPKEVYAYPQEKTISVGVPISRNFHVPSAQEVQQIREKLGLGAYKQVLLITGGGLGAQRVNDAVVSCASDLLRRYPQLAIVHLAGRAHEDGLRRDYKRHIAASDTARVIVKGFINNLHEYSAASDVVITRAGGTSMAEFAAQAKACVVIPNPFLTGGHQLKNAKVLADRKAIKLVSEDKLMHDHSALMPPLVDLFDNPAIAVKLGKRLGAVEQTNAAYTVAMLLLEQAKSHKR